MKTIFKGMPVVFLACLLVGACAALSNAHFKVTVTDGQGNPVKGAHVQGYFTNSRYDYKPQPERLGVTDKYGKTEVSGPGIADVYVRVYKKGYYESQKKISIVKSKNRAISFVLRPKKNPIAMYAKHMVVQVDKNISTYGLNLIDGTVVLSGKRGTDSDVYISSRIKVKSSNWANLDLSHKLELTFPHKNDGVAVARIDEKWWDSKYKSAYQAPKNGYMNVFEVSLSRSKSGGIQNKNIDEPLYLRIRTVTNKNGKIVSAIYCKVFPGISVMGALSDTPGFEMTYYCDPTPNDRNVEFDLNKNLFKSLKPDNRVLAP